MAIVNRGTFRSILVTGAAAAVLAIAAPAAIAAEIIAFEIAEQSLAGALNAYGVAADRQVLYARDVVAGKTSKGVIGDYEPETALLKILDGTGLAFRETASNVVLVGDPRDRKFSADDSVRPIPIAMEREETQEADKPAAGDGDATKEKRSDEVVVTGTRIKGSNAVASPVYAFDREDFGAAGANSVQDVLRSLPQNFTGGSSEYATAVLSTRNGADYNLGFGASVNLRGLGTESTLVLLNGRRMAPGGFGNLTDVSTIPLSAIERIDVMPDGASAIYGSDAVGGVVNFVLREDFDGAETRARYASVTDGGLTQFSASQVVGATWSTGAALLNVDYGRNRPLRAKDRPFATGLQTGETDLSPEDERIGFLFNGRQDLTPDLALSAVAYGVVRDAKGRVFDVFQNRQTEFEGTTTQFGGTLALDWRIDENWTVTLAHTQSRSKNERDSFFAASSAAPELRTFVTAVHDADTSELEAEGVLFALPGGLARIAFGAERRSESLSVERSSGYVDSSFDRTVVAGYGELHLPLIGDANAMPFARGLSLTLAGRYEDYDDVGVADTYKVGALWSPVDHLNLRATYGTSFRAPYLYQYDASLSAGIILDMPDAAAISGFTRTAIIMQMPDSKLGPENATIWSAGFDVAPDLFGLRLSGTYFNIAYEDRIAAARLHFGAFADPSLIPLIAAPADPRLIDLLDEVVQYVNLTPGDLSTVEASFDGRTRNQAATRMTGVDLVVGRGFETGVGDFDAGLSLTKLLSHDVQTAPGAPLVDILDTIFYPVDLRGRANFSWRLGGWSASAFVNYVDDYVDNQSPGTPGRVSSWTTVDLGLSYTVRDPRSWLNGATFRVNAINALDENPPRIVDLGSSYGNPGYDTENANPIGRLIAVEVSKSW